MTNAERMWGLAYVGGAVHHVMLGAAGAEAAAVQMLIDADIAAALHELRTMAETVHQKVLARIKTTNAQLLVDATAEMLARQPSQGDA